MSEHDDVRRGLEDAIAGVRRMLEPDFVAPGPMIRDVLACVSNLVKTLEPLIPDGDRDV
jgi:hypothetical protein